MGLYILLVLPVNTSPNGDVSIRMMMLCASINFNGSGRTTWHTCQDFQLGAPLFGAS